jgi:ABC-2 type transport system permease protein
MNKIWTIITKEWAEVFKNRLVLFSVAFMPLIFIALPIVTMIATQSFEAESSGEITEESFPGFEQLCVGMNEVECGQVYMLNLYTLMFMILPVAIPVTIAAYSIVGEKATRSLEPLLATPITTAELLAGKAISAVVPALVATWLSFAIYVIVMRFLVTDRVFGYLLDPLWLLAIFVVGPLLTFLSVSIAVMISARVTDPRVAEQLSMVVLLPVILAVVGQSVGLFIVDRTMVVLVAIAVLLLDLILGYVALQAFQRETILTRWK